jgi:hypothetical protein
MLDEENSCIGVQSATHEKFLEPETFLQKIFPITNSKKNTS